MLPHLEQYWITSSTVLYTTFGASRDVETGLQIQCLPEALICEYAGSVPQNACAEASCLRSKLYRRIEEEDDVSIFIFKVTDASADT